MKIGGVDLKTIQNKILSPHVSSLCFPRHAVMMRWASPQTSHCLKLLLNFYVKFTCPARSKFVGGLSGL